MNIVSVRICNVILTAVIAWSGHSNYLWYIAAMHLSIEVLNLQATYFTHPYKLYNFIFWAYELVLLERLRKVFFTDTIEWLLNCAEHFSFAIVICLKVYIYTAVFTGRYLLNRWWIGAIAVIVFNIIGLFNEVFQNTLAHRSAFVFIPDSIKDLKMNLLGTGVFISAVVLRIFWVRKNLAH